MYHGQEKYVTIYVWVCWNLEKQQNFSKTSETIGIRSLGGNAGEKTKVRTEESVLCMCTVQYDSYQSYVAPDTEIYFMGHTNSILIRHTGSWLPWWNDPGNHR